MYLAKELEPYGIGTGQFFFLISLFHKDGILQEELANCLKIDKGTTARAINKLVSAGYVVKEPNKNDLRSNYVCLTDKGKSFQPILETILTNWNDIISNGISENQVILANQLLEKMATNATEHIKEKKVDE
jgi:DNA-binding MarR family transcriptional regulator